MSLEGISVDCGDALLNAGYKAGGGVDGGQHSLQDGTTGSNRRCALRLKGWSYNVGLTT